MKVWISKIGDFMEKRRLRVQLTLSYYNKKAWFLVEPALLFYSVLNLAALIRLSMAASI